MDTNGHESIRLIRVHSWFLFDRLWLRLCCAVLFEQSDHEVYAHLARSNGAQEEVYCHWLIGCDGAHSTVREALSRMVKNLRRGRVFVLGDAAHVHGSTPALYLIKPFPFLGPLPSVIRRHSTGLCA